MGNGGYSYPLSRAATPSRRRFANYESYLAERADKAGVDRMLCQVLEGAAQRAIPKTQKTLSSEWSRFSWITPVLGSGSLEAPRTPGKSARELSLGVGLRLDDWLKLSPVAWPEGSESLSSLGEKFSLSLAMDRLRVKEHDLPGRDDPDIEADDVDASAAGLVLVTALLSRFYHWTSSANAHAESRWDDDVARFDPRSGDLASLGLRSTVLEPAIVVINQLVADIDRAGASRTGPRETVVAERRLDQTVKDVLQAVRDGLKGDAAVLESRHLHLLTEISWYFLTRQSSIYPGWTDLLLSVMLRTGEKIDEMGARRPQPSITNLKQLPNIVEGLVVGASRASWLNRFTEESLRVDANDSVSEAVAEVLWAEATAIKSTIGTAEDRLPPAVAFVTSFDMEVEMSLARMADGRNFFVVMPIHLTKTSDPNEAELFWIMGEFAPLKEASPLEQFEQLRRPLNWTVLSTQSKPEDFERGPIVVHLNGAPLYKLPTFDSELRDMPLINSFRRIGVTVESGESADSDTKIEHAVIVEEYLAMRHSEAEFFWSAREISDSKFKVGRALPPELSKDSANVPRFWLALGIAIADPAIRLRIVSQMTVRRLGRLSDPTPRVGTSTIGARPKLHASESDAEDESEGASEEPERTDVEGLAVNLRVDDDETMLLYWLGLDVVEDDCNVLIEDLHHYTRHLSAKGPRKHPPLDLTCPLLKEGG
jgi:hypothetical protein